MTDSSADQVRAIDGTKTRGRRSRPGPGKTTTKRSATTPLKRLAQRQGVAGAVPRRTQAERSDATRKLLIEAAIRLVRAEGFAAMKTVEVARLAGVSRGALLHHFKSKRALVREVLRYVNDVSSAESTRRAQSHRTESDLIAEIIRDAREFYFGDYFFIELAIAMSPNSPKSLKRDTFDTSRPARLSVEAAWVDALIAAGLPKQLAKDVLALTMSVVRGQFLRTMIDKDPEQVTRLLSVWRTIIREHIERNLPAQV